MGSSEVARIMAMSVEDGGRCLTSSREFVVVDMRPRAKGGRVGQPGLPPNRWRPVLVKRRMFSAHGVDPACADRRRKAADVNKKSEFFFISSSGGHSKTTAQVTAAIVFARYRSGGGFEGPLDSRRLSGRLAAWNAAGVH